MRWTNIKKEDFIGLRSIDSKNAKHLLNLSPNSKNLIKYEDDDNDTRVVSMIVNNKPLLFDLKNILLSLQKEYDNSHEINCFKINNKIVWLDKTTRISILDYLNREKSNIETTTIWFNNFYIEIEVNKAITLLKSVDRYAKQCFDNTHKHYIEINQLETIEDCLQYDITAGYPDILNITLTD